MLRIEDETFVFGFEVKEKKKKQNVIKSNMVQQVHIYVCLCIYILSGAWQGSTLNPYLIIAKMIRYRVALAPKPLI